MAKLAEQAERYEERVEFMEKVAESVESVEFTVEATWTPGTTTASRPLLSASPQPAQPANQSSGARVPFSEYLIVPMSGQSGAS
jgi:hypothetical protein